MNVIWPGLVKVDQAAGVRRQVQKAVKSRFAPGADQQPHRAVLPACRLSQEHQQSLGDILRAIGLIEGVACRGMTR